MNVDNTRTWLRTAALRIRSVPELISNVVLNWKRRGRPREIAIGSTKDTFKGRTAIVTGANAGIGRDLSLALASRGAHVIMACRSLERGHAAMQSMNKQMMTQRHNDTTFETGSLHGRTEVPVHGSFEVAELDLANFTSVNRFVREWERKHAAPPSLLFCNAGIMAPPKRQQTCDGLELQFQVNYLSHWLLARSLTERRQPPPTSAADEETAQKHNCRVILLSSCTYTGGHFNFNDLQAKQHYNPLQSYADSKLAVVTAAYSIQQRFERNRSGHTAVVVDPGVLDTKLARDFFHQQVPSFLQPLLRPLVDVCISAVSLPVETATESLLWAATAPEQQVKGRHIKNSEVTAASERVYNIADSERLWQESCKLTGFNSTE